MGKRAWAGLGALLLAFISLAPGMHSAPIITPSFDTCSVTDYSRIQNPPTNLNCCPPLPTRPEKKFEFPTTPTDWPIRVRPAVQCADATYIKKLAKAYELMRALPDTDPRSLVQQGNLHCAYCGGAFKVPGSNDTGIDIHFSWLFFPWHRAYIYFHERILRSLLKDPTFSLPFWNWDNQLDTTYAAGGDSSKCYVPGTGDTAQVGVAYVAGDNSNCFLPGNRVPDAYIENPSLNVQRGYGYNFFTNVSNKNLPDEILDISSPIITNWSEFRNKPRSAQIAANLYTLYNAVVAPNDAQTFYGAPLRVTTPRQGPTFENAYKGAIEMGPHVAAHFWARAIVEPFSQSFGNWNAAQDPLFFANHGNIDRLWAVWKSLGGPRRQDLTDPDWLNVEFKFYDENADLVTIKVSDVLSTERLGYKYQAVADAWTNYNYAPACSKVSPQKLAKLIASTPIGVPAGAVSTLPESGFQTVLERPPQAVGFDHDAGSMEEILEVTGVKLDRNVAADFAVFVNAPDALSSETRWSCAEFLGRFAYSPVVGGPTVDISHRSFSLRASIGKKLQLLGINHHPKLLITIFPLVTQLNLQSDGTPLVAAISFEDVTIRIVEPAIS